MSNLNRRSFLRLGAAAFAASQVSPSQSQVSALHLTEPAITLPVADMLKPRSAAAIQSSPLSVGFETLDRKMFEPEKTYPALAKLGAKWARVQTGWARTERQKGQYDFAWLDQVVDSLRKIGIQPWFSVSYGNRLYTPGAPHETAVGFVPLNSPEARAAWVAYVEKLAERFRGRVRHFEIWKEPNLNAFWRPKKPDPRDYAEFVALTVPAIRKRAPDAVIIGFALAGLGSDIGNQSALHLDFVKGAFEAGIGAHIDKVSYHPYRLLPEANYEDEVRALRRLIAQYKSGVAIWQGENGASSAANELGQAKWLLRRIMSDLALDVELTSYYHTCDLANYFTSAGPRGRRMTLRMGLLRDDYTPKPSYVAYQSLCALFDSRSQRTDLAAMFHAPAGGGKGPRRPVESVRRAAFVRDNQPIYAYWQPSDPWQSSPPREVDVTLWSDVPLVEPVLLDPLSQRVYGLKPQVRGFTNDFTGLPLFDYPLIVIGRAALPS